MTVTYSDKVANARLCAFSRLLFYWRGSIYKLVYKEMLIFMSLYGLFSVLYRFVMNESEKRLFEKVAIYCNAFTNLIPLSFILGFYVAIVVTRWWNQYLHIPWPDNVMAYVATVVNGFDDKSRLLRRTIMRYMQLGSLIVFQMTSPSVKKRFPTQQHLIAAGLMTESESAALEEIDTPHGKWWVPFVWCCNLCREALHEGRITDGYLFSQVIQAIQQYRSSVGMLYSYDWISIPLVYTQVTTLAVYTFFLGCIFGSQFLDPAQGYPGYDVDLYFPVFTVLQFFFYMGWLKVAEQMINPFGDDDDDFDMHWIIDRNLQISLLTVDDLYMSYPKLEADMYFNEMPPPYLPYTEKTVTNMTKPFMGSTAEIRVNPENYKVVNPMETIQEGVTMNNSTPVSPGCDSSVVASPLTSPMHSRRHTMLSTQRQNSFKQSGLSINSKAFSQVDINHQPGDKTPSYIDYWMHQRGINQTRPSTPNGDNASILRPDSLHVSAVNSPSCSRRDVSIDMPPMTNMSSSYPHTRSHGNHTGGHPGTQPGNDDVFLPQGQTAVKSPLALEVPSVVVTSSSQADLCEKLNKLLERNLSSSSESGNSSPERVSPASSVEQLESHQSTITSQTPLLNAQELEQIRQIAENVGEVKSDAENPKEGCANEAINEELHEVHVINI